MNVEENTGEMGNVEAQSETVETQAQTETANADVLEDVKANLGNDDENQTIEHEVWDYQSWSKEALLNELKEIKLNSLYSANKNKLKDLKIAFDSIFKEEKKNAYDAFIASGGEKDGFDYRDELSSKFFDLNKEVYDARKKQRNQQEEQRIENTKKKEFLLNQLRDLVDGDEATNTHKKIQEIQNTWKETGPVSQQSYRELNANYHGVLDRYYSRRSIYFELKDLDRKKNEEKKNAVIEKVEGLLSLTNTLDAVKQLNVFHGEYKNIGPVPQEKSEPMWEQLKIATDKVRARRDEFLKEYQVILDGNLEIKKGLVEKVRPYAEKTSEAISEWKDWTNEVLEIQKKWKDLGPSAREDKNETSNNFWGLSRQFFNSKKAYFAKLDGERGENLEKKKALCAKVDALKDAEDFKSTAEEIKLIQAEWKKIGRAPKAQNETIYQEFRSLCDHFFNRRSKHFDERDNEQEENFKKKEALVGKIDKLTKKSSKEDFEVLVKDYFEIGYVPRNKINASQKSFEKATSKFIDSLESLSENEVQELKLSVELGSVKGTPLEADFKRNKSNGIRKKIGGINDEISTYKNNLEFFAHSKNIDEIRADVDKKIALLDDELNILKEQLKLLK